MHFQRIKRRNKINFKNNNPKEIIKTEKIANTKHDGRKSSKYSHNHSKYK